MVGANGFEPSTSWSRTRRASQAALRPDESAGGKTQPKREYKISIAGRLKVAAVAGAKRDRTNQLRTMVRNGFWGITG